MYRSYLIATLFLSLLLVFGGCAKKAVNEVETTPVPAVVETASEPPKVVTVTKVEPVVAPSVEELLTLVDKSLKTVLFEYDSYVLTASAQQLLENNAEKLMGTPEAITTIEGHCDERGSDEYNLALGERRALATKNYLAKLGVVPESLAIISYGEERPASAGHDEMAWEKNRRVEFR